MEVIRISPYLLREEELLALSIRYSLKVVEILEKLSGTAVGLFDLVALRRILPAVVREHRATNSAHLPVKQYG